MSNKLPILPVLYCWDILLAELAGVTWFSQVYHVTYFRHQYYFDYTLIRKHTDHNLYDIKIHLQEYLLMLLTCKYAKSVACSHVLSLRSLVTLGNLIEMPSAVWIWCRVNSAPVISHTGDFWSGKQEKWSFS